MKLDPKTKAALAGLRAENRKLRNRLQRLADSIDGMAGEMFLSSMTFEDDDFVRDAAKDVNRELEKARTLLALPRSA